MGNLLVSKNNCRLVSTFITWPGSVLILLLPNLVWISRDQTIFMWDQANYAESTVKLWHTFVTDLPNWPSEAVKILRIQAPGIAWIGEFFVPIGQFLKNIDSALLYSVLLAQAGTLILAYRIGQAYIPKNSAGAWVAALLTASSPLFVGVSQRYLVEPLQTFAVTYIYWLALASSQWDFRRTLGHLLLAGSLAMLAKASSPLYCFLPVGVIVINVAKNLHQSELKKARWKNGNSIWLVLGTFFFVLVASWYLVNYKYVLQHIRNSSNGDHALYWGTKAPLIDKFEYWLTATQQSFFVPEILVFVLLVVAISLAFYLWRGFPQSIKIDRDINRTRTTMWFSACAQIVVVLAVFSLNINEDPRFLLPITPALVTLIAGVIKWLPYMSSILITSALTIQILYVDGLAHGYFTRDTRLSTWLIPVNTSSALKQKMGELELTICNEETAKDFRIIGVALIWLSDVSMHYYSEKAGLKRGFRCSYGSLGWAEKDSDVAWNNMVKASPRYFVSVNSLDPNLIHPFNNVSKAVLERVRQDSSYQEIPFDNPYGVVVFRRRD